MGSSMQSFFEQNRIFKIIVAGFVTIFLGAIGSGLWERLLSGYVDRFSHFFLTLLSTLFHGYIDLLHRDIGKGVFTERLAILQYAFFITILLIGPWLFLLYGNFKLKRMLKKVDMPPEDKPQTVEEMKKEIKSQLNRLRRLLLFVSLPAALISTVLYTSEFIETTYSRKASLFLDRSIEIVAPYVSNQDLLVLRANYRSIDNADKFYELEERLHQIAKQNNLQLPPFESIKR